MRTSIWYVVDVAEISRDADIEFSGQPYWDYGRYMDRPMEEWPMFDGSDTSLGGNGKPDTPNPDCNCVTDGPFADWKVNLGPAAGNHACTPNPQDDGLGFNERCLERKWRPELLQNLTYDNMQHSILNMQSESLRWPEYRFKLIASQVRMNSAHTSKRGQ